MEKVSLSKYCTRIFTLKVEAFKDNVFSVFITTETFFKNITF